MSESLFNKVASLVKFKNTFFMEQLRWLLLNMELPRSECIKIETFINSLVILDVYNSFLARSLSFILIYPRPVPLKNQET